MLHGIYGSGRNWSTVARRLVRARPEWGVLLVDLREHGDSRGFPPPHTLAAAAADVSGLIAGTGLAVAGLLGHSFGGKVALCCAADRAREHADGLRSVWVVDASPEARAPAGSAWDLLAAVRQTPGPFPNREDAVQALLTRGVAAPVAEWMALNLRPDADGSRAYRWRLDFQNMEELLADFFRADLWSVVEEPPPGLDLNIVKAEESSALSEAACRRIEEAGARTGRVHLHRVAGGHWVNADNPDALIELLEAGLP